MSKVMEFTGVRFSKLLVVSLNSSGVRGKLWNCVCDCGNTTTAYGSRLNTGRKKSCGCLRSESMSMLMRSGVIGANRTTHGKSETPEYATWSRMRNRCLNPNHPKYVRYGGRGISVCERWSDFANFFDDMGEKPVGTSLDRINNDGNYSPENCRWATANQQARNKSNNIFVTVNGDTKTMTEVAQENGIRVSTFWQMLKSGQSAESIISKLSPRATGETT